MELVLSSEGCNYKLKNMRKCNADMMSSVPTEVTDAIRRGSEIPDSKLAALSTLTRSLTGNRGNVSQDEINDFLAAGYSEIHVLGIIAGIAVKTMSNYSNHITQPELDAAFAGRVWISRKTDDGSDNFCT